MNKLVTFSLLLAGLFLTASAGCFPEESGSSSQESSTSTSPFVPPSSQQVEPEHHKAERTPSEPEPKTNRPAGPYFARFDQRFPELFDELALPKGLDPRDQNLAVREVIDGDTLYLRDGRKIRLVGINTPERETPLYQEAKDYLKRVASNQTVSLEYDKERKDKFGRHLCYVYQGGRMLNGELVRRGLAYSYRFWPNTQYYEQFKALQRAARTDGYGLWSLEPPTPEDTYYADGRNDKRFHRKGCERLRRQKPIRFRARAEAFDTGRNPCTVCAP